MGNLRNLLFLVTKKDLGRQIYTKLIPCVFHVLVDVDLGSRQGSSVEGEYRWFTISYLNYICCGLIFYTSDCEFGSLDQNVG